MSVGLSPVSYPASIYDTILGVKLLETESDHSSSSSGQVNNMWTVASTHMGSIKFIK